MRYVFAIVLASVLAILSSVVCGYFANDPAKHLTTGFSQGELTIIPWIVFIITFVSVIKGGKRAKPLEPRQKSDSTNHIPEEIDKDKSEKK
jgi:hypothetical protein